MAEMRAATEVVKLLERHTQAGYSGWVWFAPGDSTRYRVHLIVMVPVTAKGPMRQAPVIRSLLVQVETDPRNPKTVVITEPGEHALFTPEMWVDHGHPPGWWSGVRPLLAALGWTTSDFDSTDYQAHDGVDITYAMRRSRSRGRGLTGVR